MTAGEIIQEAAKTQDQSLASVQRMKQQIADSKQVGAAQFWRNSAQFGAIRRNSGAFGASL